MCAYLFLFLPIAIVIVFSFNAGRHVSELQGFSLQWYRQAWTDPFILQAVENSLVIATSSAIIATVLGTAAAISVRSVRRTTRRIVEFLAYTAVIIPAIVLGISLLLAFVLFADWANPWLEYLWPGVDPPQIGLGRLSVIAGESVFGIALVMIIVGTRFDQLDERLARASQDLYATPRQTLFQVTLPQLRSAMAGGFLLSFTFAFDDFIIAFFTRGQAQTVPIVPSSPRSGEVGPAINAIASVLVVVTLVLLVIAPHRDEPTGRQLVLRSGAHRSDDHAEAESPGSAPAETVPPRAGGEKSAP